MAEKHMDHIEAILLYDSAFDSTFHVKGHHLDVGPVHVRDVLDQELVDHIIPSLLQNGAHAWLLVYAIPAPDDGPTDALVIPVVPGEFGLPDMLFLAIERLLEVVYFNLSGSDRALWTPAMGLASLLDPASRERFAVSAIALHSATPLLRPLQSPLKPPQLQHIAPSAQDTTNDLSTRDASAEAKRIFDDAVAKIQGQLSSILAGADAERTIAVKESANTAIYHRLRRLGVPDTVPEIVRKYQETMDSETRRFLVSAATVAAFVEAHPDIAAEFDYSITGAGLCKAVEREVKRSMAFHLGLNPRDFSTYNVEQILSGNAVTIDKRRYDGASIQSSLERCITPELFKTITDENGYLKELDRFREIRNEVAHIDPVQEERYRSLAGYAGLEAPVNIDESVLGRTLQSKKQQRESGITIY